MSSALLFSKPGSLTVYTTAVRQGLPPPSDCPPTCGPANYCPRIMHFCIPEIVAPFHTTEERGKIKYNDYPGPLAYFPFKRPRIEYGTINMNVKGERFPPDRYCTGTPGSAGYYQMDEWDWRALKFFLDTQTKRPRVKYEKFVSNNVPTIFGSNDMYCFITGIDGRMYPWWKDRKPRIPGPKYDIANIYTSKSPGPYFINFGAMAERRPLFPPIPGFGPADFYCRIPLNQYGGIFLSKGTPCTESIPRLFEKIVMDAERITYPSPLHYYPKGSFDQPSPKAVMAPFKSKVPRLGFSKKEFGPGPAAHFMQTMTIDDVWPPVFPYSLTKPPEAEPFNTTEKRFFDLSVKEQMYHPSPFRYNIMGFTDKMRYDLWKHAPAVCNPKLGFLTSALQRPKGKFTVLEELEEPEPESPRRTWQNIRPKRVRTYPYHGTGPPNLGPGPKYDTAPAMKAIKGRKSWWNPRDYTGTGFENSGCGRKIVLDNIDKINPGPAAYHPTFPPASGGNITSTGPRFRTEFNRGPGPRHKLHEKCESVWQGTQLGTYNVYLKGIGGIHPNSGGYHPFGPIDPIGDAVQGFYRMDGYEADLPLPNSLTNLSTQNNAQAPPFH